MNAKNPRVSIGLPVHNGENHLGETLETLLAQSYANFELVISDNASTDGTEEICRTYAAADPRIRYFRNEENLGASRNFNRVFQLSSGEYFKWAAHDDLCAPEFVARCVEVLESDDSVVLSFSRSKEIDGEGVVLREYESKPRFGSPQPRIRFHECVCVSHPQIAVFGLFRTGILKRTRLIGNYSSSDRTLLGEIVLHGRFYEIPEFLFYKRDHAQQHWRQYPTRRSREVWYDPARAGKLTFPHWRLLQEHLISIHLAPLSRYDRLACYATMAKWVRKYSKHLARNVVLLG